MRKVLPVLVFLANASAFCGGSMAAQSGFATGVFGAGNAVVLAGGMGGGAGGGMTGGGPIGSGLTGTTGRGIGGTTGYSDAPGAGGDPYNRSGTSANEPQPPQSYHCVTQKGQCSVSSALGPLRSGSSCGCLFGGKGKIK